MKKIYNLILVAVALFAVQPVVKAQPYTEKNNIAYSKYPTGPVDGIYTIHLDTFVTGEKTVTESSLPADIILVLDVSGSMAENISTYSYTARASQSYSYDGYGNNTYYYRYTDGNYYQVTRERTGTIGNRIYSLNVTIGGTTYYLSGTSLVGTRPTTVTSNTATIWTGVLYTRQVVETKSKMEALQDAVEEFIDEIKKNNDYMADGETARETPLGNQIAIVKFAMNRYYNDDETSIAEGDHSYRYSNQVTNANYTEVVKAFTNVNEAANVAALKTAVNGLHAAGATAADYGMRKAQLLLNDLIENNPDRQSNKTVILFTDGAPTYSSSFEDAVANNTISRAHDIKGIKAYTDPEKGDQYTTVFTVGVFDNPSTNTLNYMSYTSSNYPDAQSMTNAGTGSDKGFFFDASDGVADLSSIFRSIAQAAGGSQATTVTAEATTTVDIISQSFDLPYGADSTKIKVYFANCLGKDANGYLYFDVENKMENPEYGEEGHVSIKIDTTTQKITATGFDYSGHWCGKDESLGENEYHGMKLMLEIPIEMAEDAVGGQNVGTNGPESGIYVDGEPVLIFDIPAINLPTNLHIKKEGIADGECATFEIYRKKIGAAAWETTPFKTVMVIGGQRDNTVKLMGLDPTYVYKIVEAGWSWSYSLDHVKDYEGNVLDGEITSDRLITNPFIFVNTKNATQVRHAESAVYNDFSKAGTVSGLDAVGENITSNVSNESN